MVATMYNSQSHRSHLLLVFTFLACFPVICDSEKKLIQPETAQIGDKNFNENNVDKVKGDDLSRDDSNNGIKNGVQKLNKISGAIRNNQATEDLSVTDKQPFVSDNSKAQQPSSNLVHTDSSSDSSLSHGSSSRGSDSDEVKHSSIKISDSSVPELKEEVELKSINQSPDNYFPDTNEDRLASGGTKADFGDPISYDDLTRNTAEEDTGDISYATDEDDEDDDSMTVEDISVLNFETDKQKVAIGPAVPDIELGSDAGGSQLVSSRVQSNARADAVAADDRDFSISQQQQNQQPQNINQQQNKNQQLHNLNQEQQQQQLQQEQLQHKENINKSPESLGSSPASSDVGTTPLTAESGQKIVDAKNNSAIKLQQEQLQLKEQPSPLLQQQQTPKQQQQQALQQSEQLQISQQQQLEIKTDATGSLSISGTDANGSTTLVLDTAAAPTKPADNFTIAPDNNTTLSDGGNSLADSSNVTAKANETVATDVNQPASGSPAVGSNQPTNISITAGIDSPTGTGGIAADPANAGGKVNTSERVSSSGSTDAKPLNENPDEVLPVDSNHKELPSFDEWRQKEQEKHKHLEAQHQQQQQQHQQQQQFQPSSSHVKAKTPQKQINYAAVTCGAKVVAANPEAQNAVFVLFENRDQYMIQPCKAKKVFTVELCESIQIQTIELGNLELFSSIPERFDVHVSDRYPTKDWRLLGSFKARDERSIQTFPVTVNLLNSFYAKYIRIEIQSHYGAEHYCPLSILRVNGITVDEDDDIDEREVLGVGDSAALDGDMLTADKDVASTNLFSSATDTVLSLVKTVLNPIAGAADCKNNNAATGVTRSGTGRGTEAGTAASVIQPCTPQVSSVGSKHEEVAAAPGVKPLSQHYGPVYPNASIRTTGRQQSGVATPNRRTVLSGRGLHRRSHPMRVPCDSAAQRQVESASVLRGDGWTSADWRKQNNPKRNQRLNRTRRPRVMANYHLECLFCAAHDPTGNSSGCQWDKNSICSYFLTYVRPQPVCKKRKVRMSENEESYKRSGEQEKRTEGEKSESKEYINSGKPVEKSVGAKQTASGESGTVVVTSGSEVKQSAEQKSQVDLSCKDGTCGSAVSGMRNKQPDVRNTGSVPAAAAKPSNQQGETQQKPLDQQQQMIQQQQQQQEQLRSQQQQQQIQQQRQSQEQWQQQSQIQQQPPVQQLQIQQQQPVQQQPGVIGSASKSTGSQSGSEPVPASAAAVRDVPDIIQPLPSADKSPGDPEVSGYNCTTAASEKLMSATESKSPSATLKSTDTKETIPQNSNNGDIAAGNAARHIPPQGSSGGISSTPGSAPSVNIPAAASAGLPSTGAAGSATAGAGSSPSAGEPVTAPKPADAAVVVPELESLDLEDVTYQKLTSRSKESIFVKLKNRIKNLEVNLNLSNRYLEELSQRYKIQMDGMYTSLNKTIARLGATAKSVDEKDQKQNDRLTNLEVVVGNLSDAVSSIQILLESFQYQMVERHLFLMTAEFFIFIAMLIYTTHRSSSSRPAISLTHSNHSSISIAASAHAKPSSIRSMLEYSKSLMVKPGRISMMAKQPSSYGNKIQDGSDDDELGELSVRALTVSNDQRQRRRHSHQDRHRVDSGNIIRSGSESDLSTIEQNIPIFLSDLQRRKSTSVASRTVATAAAVTCEDDVTSAAASVNTLADVKKRKKKKKSSHRRSVSSVQLSSIINSNTTEINQSEGHAFINCTNSDSSRFISNTEEHHSPEQRLSCNSSNNNSETTTVRVQLPFLTESSTNDTTSTKTRSISAQKSLHIDEKSYTRGSSICLGNKSVNSDATINACLKQTVVKDTHCSTSCDLVNGGNTESVASNCSTESKVETKESVSTNASLDSHRSSNSASPTIISHCIKSSKQSGSNLILSDRESHLANKYPIQSSNICQINARKSDLIDSSSPDLYVNINKSNCKAQVLSDSSSKNRASLENEWGCKDLLLESDCGKNSFASHIFVKDDVVDESMASVTVTNGLERLEKKLHCDPCEIKLNTFR